MSDFLPSWSATNKKGENFDFFYDIYGFIYLIN